jgi:hypothetical protein
MIDAISNFFRAAAEFLGWSRQRDAEKNAADVKAGQAARDEQAEVDAETKATADHDADRTRSEISE